MPDPAIIAGIDRVCSEAFAFPTILFGFLMAEYIRANFLKRQLPGNPAFRFAAVMACGLMATNALAACFSSLGVRGLDAPNVPETTAVLFFLLGIGPVWWALALLHGLAGHQMPWSQDEGTPAQPSPG